MRQLSAGFSLYELLITSLLVVLLAAIAIPSFVKIVANGRIRTEANALFHAIHFARKQSLVGRTVVSICPSPNGQDCSAQFDWSSGWIMFNNDDHDEPPQRDAGESVVKVHRSDPSLQIHANRRGFSLRGVDKRATNGTLVVCDRNGRAVSRAVIVGYTGRPRISRTTAAGQAYRCG